MDLQPRMLISMVLWYRLRRCLGLKRVGDVTDSSTWPNKPLTVNSKRQENKIKELDVFVINLVDQTAELKLSSSEIRRYLSKADE